MRISGNINNEPIYKKGSPCSACPNNTQCETKEYPSLCGKLFPAPIDPPFKASEQANGAVFYQISRFSVFMILVVFWML